MGTKRLFMMPNRTSNTAYINKVLGTSASNLIAYWPMNEGSGAISLDLSGQGNNGAYTGVTLGEEGIGDGNPAPLFDGANDYNDVYSAAFNADFDGQEGTCIWWAKVSSVDNWTASSNDVMIGIRPDSNNVLEFFKSATDNRLVYVYIAGGTNETINQDGVSSIDWMAFAVTWSLSTGGDGEMKAYFNGAQTGATRTSLGTFAGNLDANKTVVGAENDTPAFPWNGFMAHVAIWNTPLAAAQIADLAIV